MAPRKSPIWQYYTDDPDDLTNALCRVTGCKKPKISRGREKNGLSSTPLVSHLKFCHHKEYSAYLLTKNNNMNVEENKKRQTEEVDNIETKFESFPGEKEFRGIRSEDFEEEVED